MKVFVLAMLAFLAINANAQSTKWSFDQNHTRIGFSVVHMMISNVDGNFKKFDGEVLSDKPDFSDAKINFKIDASSVNTDIDKRDEDLRSPNFFDVQKFPNITFVGEKMKKISKGKYKLTGDFTMHGVTKKITLDVSLSGVVNDPWGGIRAGFKITGNLKRSDYGLTYNKVLETGGFVVSDKVDLICNVELVKAK